MMFRALLVLSFVALVSADLRMASQPKNAWKTQPRNRNIEFRRPYALYMEPSDFNYAGLIKQRDGGGYDNFLRSNIDNEQDRRDFNTENGKDHLPFRSYETAANDAGQSTVKNKMAAASADATGVDAAGNYIELEPGTPFVIPIRWNNPHSSELEVNIWVMNKAGGPYVIPILKPTCAGEGYQDAAFTVTVPSDFNTKASCRNVGECVLQVYAHSVESRMYSSGTPVIVTGGTGAWTDTIQDADVDVAFDLASLRRLCLPSSDPNSEADHTSTVVYKARLSSDQYNHAYQNSDFSPYAGQQPKLISQNLQASCILKMTANNFGELGKQYMAKTANDARSYANQLDKKARNLIRTYETVTNGIIEVIKEDVANTNTLKHAGTPAGFQECTEWRDRWDRVAGGRLRGNDRNGGYCPVDKTCLCKGDCYLGYGTGDLEKDGYCGTMVPKNEDEDGLLVLEAGSEEDRTGQSPQKTETCFRCAEVGSLTTRRHNTNTYIPSFEIHGAEAVEKARQYVAPVYYKHGFMTHPDTGAITAKGDDKAVVQIYMGVLTEMWEEFKKASDGSYLQEFYTRTYDKLKDPETGEVADSDLEKYKFTYRGPVLKDTTATLSDANGGVNHNYKKLDEAGNQDKGYYSAAKAWYLQDRITGSSTAVPSTTGPLNARIPESTNHADGTKSGGGSTTGSTTYKMPPDEAASTSCSYANTITAGEITEEGADMDGLNRDADCDSDSAIEALMIQHEADCEKELEADEDYVCPDFEEPECHIEGEDDQLPTQMFSNTDTDGSNSGISAASSAFPSVFVAVFSVLAVLSQL